MFGQEDIPIGEVISVLVALITLPLASLAVGLAVKAVVAVTVEFAKRFVSSALGVPD